MSLKDNADWPSVHVTICCSACGNLIRLFTYSQVLHPPGAGFVRGCVGLMTLAAVAQISAQHPVPLDDNVDVPLTPAAINEGPTPLSGEWAYLWSEGDQQVIQILGGFRMSIGPQELQAADAVLWISRREFNGRPYHDLEIFLWQDAQIIDPGGPMTAGPALFATASTFGPLRLHIDLKSHASAAASRLYADAIKIRDAVRAGTLNTNRPAPLDLIDLPLPRVRASQMTFSPGPRARIVNGEWVATMLDGVHFSRGAANDANFIEGQARAAVLFADPPADNAGGGFDPANMRGVYLEGDVVVTQGDRFVRANSMYYDFKSSRALILNAVMRAYAGGGDVPVYIRAREARQLSESELLARDVVVSTSEFYTPHYHIGASELYIAADAGDTAAVGLTSAGSGEFRLSDASFNVLGTPVLPWPAASGNLKRTDGVLKGVSMGNDDDFGFTFETRWQPFSLLSMQTPEGFEDTTFGVDVFTKRGIGFSLNSDYEHDKDYGEFRGYYINDDEDQDNLGPMRDNRISNSNRGRATWRHRQYLDDDWDLTIEVSYLSDENFLESYFEDEFDNAKDQETYIQMRKQRDNWAFTITNEVQVNNWLPVTESHPDVAFRMVGEPIGPFTWFSENRIGIVRRRPDERNLFTSTGNPFTQPQNARSGAVFRLDSRQEIQWPFDVGPIRVAPFATGRATYWDDSPTSGGVGRGYGVAGVRGSMYLSRTQPNASSDILDINGLRHIIKIDGMGWIAGSSRPSKELFFYNNGIEDIDAVSGATFGVRQRWQTKRGAPGRERTVDVLTIDIEAGFFSNAQGDERTNGYVSMTRPEESITSNYVSTRFNWRMGDTTYLLGDASYDIDGGDIDIANLSLAVERSPRFSYFLGWRMIGETDSNLIGFGGKYKASEKHRFAVAQYTDIDRGSTERFDITYVRKFPRWFASFTVSLDEVKDNLSISFAMWPEGATNVALGNKRYTSLANSMAISDE